MKASVICFTPGGLAVAKDVVNSLEEKGYEAVLSVKSRYMTDCEDASVQILNGTLADWTEQAFETSELIVFTGACGIAVRAIAPFVKSKRYDPAVLVVDEGKQFVISLLSGHLGGANEAAWELAKNLGAVPVITTATDVKERFAVDVFAKQNHLWISDMSLAKEVSARLLRDEDIFVTADEEAQRHLEGIKFPRGLNYLKWDEQAAAEYAKKESLWIHLGVQKRRELPDATLYLVPKQTILGIGCRKGTTLYAIEEMIEEWLNTWGIFKESVCAAVSIDLKKEEPGLAEFTCRQQIPFWCYSADELKGVSGDFQSSPFVESVTGVDNVCERSAVLGAGNGRLIMKKQGKCGVTAACAVRDWRISFE
ncbi:cobalamin biosynthesis protein CbiG [uncultured Roseburia sp.]|uniref:Cobalamin biosynthesis protein n=1 Tax=Brotonthovivens ammoniilytica TaxID=2981725 RepID=A0ABT2TMA8_9FIRM|nr:cobalamin biosynthesis protein [Brotonthovivens ammoniilytica]MCU6763354.1 cobalamin biosynthesis protein [Brotonthovivens ammoniilytica]SCJ14628.1 cobalamin biosynthesis protein CbiG [uncultured Roseburia sp.]